MKHSFFKDSKKTVIGLCICAGLASSLSVTADDLRPQTDSGAVWEISQTRTLIGTVLDAGTQEPLIGVNIKIKGTTQGTITDIDGKFTIEITNGTELEVSYIGYKTKSVLVGDLGIISILLESDNEMLDEVVVVGAGTQKKVSVTGSITTVKGNSLKVPSSSLTSSLAGKLAGIMSVTSSGEPGSSSEFYIRGINTFGGRATPLILLDGVEISANDLNRIPAESIESFSILKDASATAIYGNRGANGVMLVTTKSGTENTKAKINVSVEASYFHPMNVVDFADGITYMNTYNEAQQARSLTPVTNPRYSDEVITNTQMGVNPYVYPNVDWYNTIFRKGNYNQRANINLQGGGSRVTYYMSLQANHDTGLLNSKKDYVYDNNINNWEYNFQNNISYKVTNTTTLDLRLMAQIGNQKGPNYSVSDMYKTLMYVNPVSFPAYYPMQEDDGNVIRFGNAEITSGTPGYNPYQQMLSSFAETNYSTMNASLGLTQNLDFLTKGLSLKALVNFRNWSQSNYNRTIEPYFYTVRPGSYNSETGEYELDLIKSGEDFVKMSDIYRNADQTFYFDARLDWKRSFADHNLTAMLMYMMREYRWEQLPNRNQGYSGRLTYDYMNKYLVEFNFGYNGSERLAKDDRFEFFPAMSLGWVVSSEKFWEKLSPYVDHLKLRTSYGLVGSDDFNLNAPHFLYQNNIVIGGGTGYFTGLPTNEVWKYGPAFNTMAVENAGWEHVKKFDIGFDMSLFNQVRITFDYFHDLRDRILMSRASWSNMLGYWGSVPWSNIGEVVNKGYELSVNWSKQFGKDWFVDLRGNFTYNQNEYKYVDEPDYPYTWQTKTGKPLNTLTGYVAEGLFESQEEIDRWPDQSQLGTAQLMPGDIKYRDINGDGQITTEDQVMLSPYNYIPRIQYGFGINVQYKNFDLGVFFNGSAKRDIMINSGMSPFLASGGDGLNGNSHPRNLMQWIADEHWSVDNPNPDAKYPRLGTESSHINNNIQPSSYWVRNGNFLRFKTLEFGYRFKYCRVYFSGDNLAVFSPFKLWDPELSWNAYPLQRTFNLGVQFTF